MGSPSYGVSLVYNQNEKYFQRTNMPNWSFLEKNRFNQDLVKRPSYIMSFIVTGGFMADNESDPIFDKKNSSVRRQGVGTDTIDTKSSRSINNPDSAYHQDTIFSFKVTSKDDPKINTDWREITVKLP